MKRSNPDQIPETSSSTKLSTSDPDLGPPTSKRLLSAGSEAISFTRITCLEELDKRTLQLQNKKLCEALTERRSANAELKERIEQLEHRQTKDDALLCVINRYWNQLDEDCLILLQRFEADANEEYSTSTESFLKQLASWDNEEVQEKHQERVHFSKRIIARILSSYDKMVAQRSRLLHLLATKTSDSAASSNLETAGSECSMGTSPLSPTESSWKQTNKSHSSEVVIVELKKEIQALEKENKQLQNLCTDLHAKHRQSGLCLRELQDLTQTNSDAAAEWRAKYEDLDYKLSQAMKQVTRLDHRLYDSQEQVKQLKLELSTLKGTDSPGNEESTGSVAKNKYNDLVCELDEYRELASNRTSEMEKIQRHLEDKVAECESLSMQLRDIPESVILESPQYASLKTQFNILYNEAINLRAQIDEARTTIQNNRHNHLKQIEEMESNEAAIQHQMRSEMLMIESQYSQLRHKYETMELDFKQALAHNEQAGPINCEMRSLISTLQTQNKQLKAEVVRYRRKCEEAAQEREMIKSDLKCTEDELTVVRTALSEATAALVTANMKLEHCASPTSTSSTQPLQSVMTCNVTETKSPDLELKANYSLETPIKSDEISKSNPGEQFSSSVNHSPTVASSDKFTPKLESPSSVTNSSPQYIELIRDLKEQLKRSQESQKEMSVLLNMYKVIPKDQRDKAALLQCEAKLRAELSEAKAEIEKLQTANHDLQHQLRHPQQRKTSVNSPCEVSVKMSPSDRVSSTYSSVPSSPSRCKTDIKSGSVPTSTTNTNTPKQKSTPQDWQISELQLELQLVKRKSQSMEEQLKTYQQRLSEAKQHEDVLLDEMEISVQAFEGVQEQNVRLVKTLREKDDAHLKLMAERLKTAQLARLLKEDKQLLEEQIRLMQAKIEALNRAVRKQEDKERLLLTNMTTLEKEAAARLKAQEAYKRKALESQQVSEDLRVNVQKYQSQLQDAQTSVQEKAAAFERVSFGHQRLQEELTTIRRKYERLRRIEQSHNAGDFLHAEIQDYKEQLTCPTCKVNRKDAILTKCFHVFCLNCLKIRYETRNRKCPECNTTFGANDYHRIYLT